MKPPDDLIPHFAAAGWNSDRKVQLADCVLQGVPADHPALPILTALSGLTVGACGAGEQCATSDIEFGFIDDSCTDVSTWDSLLKSQLIGIAQVHRAHAELFVDAKGRYFGFSTVHDAAWYLGDSFESAARGLLRGIESRPILRPDQRTVTLYGREFTADDSAVYDYR